MADPTTNGTSAPAPPAEPQDIAMKEEQEQEQEEEKPRLLDDQAPPSLPHPTTATTTTSNNPPDHLPSLQPPVAAAATPPAGATPTRPSPQPAAAVSTSSSTAAVGSLAGSGGSGFRPDKPVPHGGPTRQYLNRNVTPHLLEAMKYLAVYQPEKPLAWLGEFLRERSGEVEG